MGEGCRGVVQGVSGSLGLDLRVDEGSGREGGGGAGRSDVI